MEALAGATFNLHHKLRARELTAARPGASTHRSRRFYESVFPTETVRPRRWAKSNAHRPRRPSLSPRPPSPGVPTPPLFPPRRSTRNLTRGSRSLVPTRRSTTSPSLTTPTSCASPTTEGTSSASAGTSASWSCTGTWAAGAADRNAPPHPREGEELPRRNPRPHRETPPPRTTAQAQAQAQAQLTTQLATMTRGAEPRTRSPRTLSTPSPARWSWTTRTYSARTSR